MVKLFDIHKDGKVMSAKYKVVGYDGEGFIRIDAESEKRMEITKPDGDAGHAWFAHMAKKGLLRIKDMNPIPTHTSVDCY